jgi:hypothetical protein
MTLFFVFFGQLNERLQEKAVGLKDLQISSPDV